jgi:ParB family chromosome partitioning protein
MEVVSIPLTHIFTRKTARPVVQSTVNSLIDSIREIGLINPLRVRKTRLFVQGIEDDAFEVIAGGHRLAALRKLEFDTAECVIVDADALHLELAEIDENLIRAELSPADKAEQTARRKVIYLTLYPDTAADAFKGNQHTGKVADANFAFTTATAEATGKARRTVELDAERGEKISEQALALVKGTPLDKGVELDKLKKVAPEKQVQWVERRLQETRPPKPPKQAADPLSEGEACERQVARLMDAWNAAGPDARQEFMLRIDGPVFDRAAQ